MIRRIAWLLLIIFAVAACHSGAEKTAKTIPKTDTASYYPVADFFREQMDYVNLRDFNIQYLHTLDGKKDSGVLSKEDFLIRGNQFLVQAEAFRKNQHLYKESVFQDLSTNSYTLTYTPFDNPAEGIANIDVLLDENTRKITRVFIKKNTLSGDTSITEQYNWRAYQGLQVTRFKTRDKYSSLEITYINWGSAK